MNTILEFKSWLGEYKVGILTEEIAHYRDLDPDLLYQTYHQTYADAGHEPWTPEDYHSRASGAMSSRADAGWQYAGILPKPGVPLEKVGFVSVKEKDGIYKLTGMQGPNNKGKIMGILELNKTGKPIWGAMDKDFTMHLMKAGFSSPPPKAMKFLYPLIQSDKMFSFGGQWGELNPDGGMSVDLQGTGHVVKYFTANRPFYKIMIGRFMHKVNPKLLDLLQKWKHIPSFMQKMALGAAKPFLPAGVDIDAETINWLVSIMDDAGVGGRDDKGAAATSVTSPPGPGPGPGGVGAAAMSLGNLLKKKKEMV